LMRRAGHLLSEIDLGRAISTRWTRLRWILIGACVVGITIWAISAPRTLWQAGRRLAAPWRLDPWPRLVVLELDAPARIARGSDALVVVRPKTDSFPSGATVYLASDDGKVWSKPMHREANRFVISIPKVKQSLWLRAEGGDDDQMRWERMEVVESVSLTATRLLATPPDYTKSPQVKVGSDLVVLEGTKLSMEFRASRAIREARPILGGKPVASLAKLAVDSSGRKASGELTFTAPGNSMELRLDVRDREEALVSGAWRGSVKVLRDLAPVIEWRDVKALSKILPQSRPVLAARVSDDVRLASLKLRHRVVPAMSENSAGDAPWRDLAEASLEEDAKEHLYSTQIDLSELALKPGDLVEWSLVATDAKGQVKESESLRSTVVSSEELRRESDRRFERFLEQLTAAARRQRDIARSLEEAVGEEPGERGKAKRLATIRATQFDEQRLIEAFHGKGDGLLDVWQKLIEEERLHALLSESDENVAGEVSTLLIEIGQRRLPEVARELERLDGIADAADASSDAPGLDQALNLAAKASDQLDEVVDLLAHWRRWSRAAQTVGELLQAQQAMLAQTREATPKLLGRLPSELDEDEAELLQELTSGQEHLAQQLAELSPPPGLQAEGWRNSRAAADEQMRQAARDLSRNQLSQASSHQEQAVRAMQELANAGGRGDARDSTDAEPKNEQSEGAARPRSGPTEAQLREVIAKQAELKEQTKQTLDALAKPAANRSVLEAELTRLSKAQAELAKQVEAWQADADDSQELPRE
jgi:hypothetical protein